MKVSSKMVDGILIAMLALALTITSLTTNGGSAQTAQEDTTELEQNGIAGIAAAAREYGDETAAEMNMEVGIEKEDVDLVAATVYEEEEKTLSPEEEEWQDKLMADVDEFLYVRAKADKDSEIVGKLYKGDRAVIKKQGARWTKIVSGNVKGYVKNKYCVFGMDALSYAKENCDTVAEATTDGLRVRTEADAEAGVVKTLEKGEKLTVDTEADEAEGWVAVKVGSKTCYVSAEYVKVRLNTGKAVTLQEEAAAQAAQAAPKKSNGQTTETSTTKNPSLAATADEETLLAALVQCEAGGCGVECMTAVGAVVLNRVRSGSFPGTIYNVIYQRGQFGPAGSGKLERQLAAGVSSEARRAARAALAGEDPTGGAKYFKLASSGHAGVVIGPVVFY